jgi:flagellar assembly factor FliW
VTVALLFLTPPPGFAPQVEFTLTPAEGTEGLYSLQSTEAPQLRLFALDAGAYLPDYSPVISDEQSAALELTTPDDALVLVVANTGADGITVNLMAPIVVNQKTGVSAQVILEGQEWPLRGKLGEQSA